MGPRVGAWGGGQKSLFFFPFCKALDLDCSHLLSDFVIYSEKSWPGSPFPITGCWDGIKTLLTHREQCGVLPACALCKSMDKTDIQKQSTFLNLEAT